MLQIDQLSGESLFIKSGAAPSYILREGSLFKVASNTMPIGITREMNAEEIKFTLHHDDVVIMTSDGVAQSFDDSIWLTELICTQWEDDLQIMADKIREQAEQRNLHRDDITVGVIRVKECSRERAAKNVSHETLLLTE